MRFQGFPDTEVPKAALAIGLVPDDWHNDLSAAMRFPDDRDSDIEEPLTLWVGNDESIEEIGSRYMVSDEGGVEWDGTDGVLYVGNSLNEALRVIQKRRKELLSRRHRPNPQRHRSNPEPGIEHYDRRWMMAGVSFEYFTPESVERGDSEDAGWEVEKHPATFRDVTKLISFYGSRDSFYPEVGHDRIVFAGQDEVRNYRDGSSTRYDVIVEGDAVSLQRVMKWFHAKGGR